jgi:MraZ protein
METDLQDVGPLPLIGTEEATMDDKGRILVGTKLRKRLGPNFAMTIGFNGSINAFPKREWDVIVRDVMSRDPRQEARQNYARHLMGNSADELDFDTQGRVVVPKKLRELAGIDFDSKVILIGLGDYMEIWSKPIHDHQQRSTFPNHKDSLKAMLEEPVFKPGRAKDAVQVGRNSNPMTSVGDPS